MHREQKREIGDDANKIREYEKMPGRIATVAFNPTGTQFAAVSSLDGRGEVRIYNVATGAKIVCEKITGPVYTVAWHPTGNLIASAGFDGIVWLHDASTGKVVNSFIVLPKKSARGSGMKRPHDLL
jgi:WD40 repeat protein